MASSILKKTRMGWKIIGIGMVALLVLIDSFVGGIIHEQYHSEIMVGMFVSVMIFCGLLVGDVSKILRFQQDTIETLMGIKLALVSLIDLKDPYTEGHSRRVRDLAQSFSEYLQLPSEDIEEISMAAELHDIGKIGIPDAILKKPDKLNEEEFHWIKKHPVYGADALKTLKGFENIVKIIRHHHEKYDGTGYPDGLNAQEIPLGSRIISFVDAYDAMSCDRAYRKALSKQRALEIIAQAAGTQFDPTFEKAFQTFIQYDNRNSSYDPVCGMPVHDTRHALKAQFRDRIYYFCSQTCATEFNQSPQKYLSRIRDRSLN
ncbi:MAG: HD domain-containing phosphohydrolase [Nitrospinales bacterium]